MFVQHEPRTILPLTLVVLHAFPACGAAPEPPRAASALHRKPRRGLPRAARTATIRDAARSLRLVANVPTYIGSAGWNIPRIHRERFAADGSQLQRYASRLNAAEINTSFYRPHAPTTYERWASAVPDDFRFAVKVPKLITHDQLLTRARQPLTRFLGEIAGLGPKLGPLLVQLAPSFAFEPRRVGRFFDLLRRLHAGPVVCEPRHITWTTTAASRALETLKIGRVAADPPRASGLEVPGGWPGIVYYRWHGSPRPYFSPYEPDVLDALADRIRAQHAETWCMFDNTGSGAAAGNALDLSGRLMGLRR